MNVESEIDLHRHTVDEALPRLNDYLYQSFLSGVRTVCVSHGKGTGVLRQAVQRELKNSTLVKSFRYGKRSEGGNGVTIVELADH